jgi:glycosyltransferase involved in cell wall biosynthesis
MRVCFISHTSAKGGAERALLELVDGLKERGVECYVILPGDGPLADEMRKRAVAFSTLPYKHWMGKNSPIWKRIGRTVLNFAMAIPIAVSIRRWKCDVVYSNTITVCVGALAARLLGLPHVWHIHEFGYEDHGLVFDLGQRFSLWLMDRLSSVCVVNSNAVRQKYEQHIAPSKIKMFYYSVSIPQCVIKKDAERIQEDVAIRCVIVGRLTEGKGQEDAIRAVAKLVRGGIKAELLIVGRGNPKYRQHLNELVAENKLESHVKFVGYAENPLPFMQRAHVVLMCSRCEAFGRVSVEAMKLGKPVIGTRAGGTVELISDGFNGLLYTPGDHSDLAEKIRYLYEHPNAARLMGENGRQWATEQFTNDHYAGEVLVILRQLVSQRGVANS